MPSPLPANTLKATNSAKAAPARRFVFLLLERFTLLPFAGAVEPLRIANRVAGKEIYSWVLAGEAGPGHVLVEVGLEDLVHQPVHGAADGRNLLENSGAVRAVVEPALHGGELAGYPADPRHEAGRV